MPALLSVTTTPFTGTLPVLQTVPAILTTGASGLSLSVQVLVTVSFGLTATVQVTDAVAVTVWQPVHGLLQVPLAVRPCVTEQAPCVKVQLKGAEAPGA